MSAEDNSGVVVTGDHARIVQHRPVLPVAAVQAAVTGEGVRSIHNLPAPDSGVFKGREDALACLRALPFSGTGVVAQSVRGMGGVGKSTVALHHARWFLASGRGPVWWIRADSSTAVVTGLAQLAAVLNPALRSLSDEEAAEWAVTWLQGHEGWLLVLDNAEEPADLRPYLGRLGTGQVLVTTRRDLPWQDLGTPLRLDILTEDASLDVLREITRRFGEDDTAALADLAQELGYLPLALQQAGAYLVQTRTDAHTYLPRLRDDPAGVLAATAPGDRQQRTIAQLWSVTLQAVEDTDPHAVELLRILAHYAPDPLPRRVLAGALPTPQAVDHALGILHAYSMVTLTDTTVTVHRLVQSVIRSTTPPPTPPPAPRGIHRLLRRSAPAPVPHPGTTALTLLHDATPNGSPADLSAWPAWQELLPHIQSALTHHSESDTFSGLPSLAGQTAFYLRARGQAAQALPLEERALRITEATLGPDHPTTATRLNNLASTFSDLGRHTEALPLQERALRITEATLGPDHPTTATRLGNLASTFSALGRHTEALPLQERALRISEATLGPDHPTTALRLGNLASTFSDLGRHTEALPLEERALRITEATLGPDHPDTATCLNNLASTFSALGRHTEALPLEERALRITEATLGPDHPTTATCLNNLVHLRERATESEGDNET